MIAHHRFKAWNHKDNKFDSEIMIISNSNFFINDDKFTFLQYTGIKDKNGIDLCQGDIIKKHNFVNDICDLKTKSFIGLIYWAKGHGGFAVEWENGMIDFHCDNVASSELVGNIFENAFLKEKFKGNVL